MRVVKFISIIALAAFLVLQGIAFLFGITAPALYALLGILAIVAGALIFISLKYWGSHHDHHPNV